MHSLTLFDIGRLSNLASYNFHDCWMLIRIMLDSFLIILWCWPTPGCKPFDIARFNYLRHSTLVISTFQLTSSRSLAKKLSIDGHRLFTLRGLQKLPEEWLRFGTAKVLTDSEMSKSTKMETDTLNALNKKYTSRPILFRGTISYVSIDLYST